MKKAIQLERDFLRICLWLPLYKSASLSEVYAGNDKIGKYIFIKILIEWKITLL